MEYFTQLIDKQLASGAITDVQVELLENFLTAISVEQRAELQSALTAEPRLLAFILENLTKKVAAINSGDMDIWKNVVAEEIKQLDELG